MRCPGCRTSLEARTVGRAEAEACPDCGGTLVATRHLVPLLEGLAGPMLEAIDPDAPIDRVEPLAQAPDCPACGRGMEAFGYMGSPLVTLHRCGQEWLVWADPDALGAAAMLYARTNRRLMARKAKDDALREQWAASTRARAQGRASAGRMAAAIMIGGVPGAALYAAGETVVKKG